MADLSTSSATSLYGNPVVDEAHDRWLRSMRFESKARNLFKEDLKFANADSDNGYQWPNDIRRNRDVDERPCLTNNKTRQHCLQIINDAKKNKPGIKVRPSGGQATYEAAQMWDSIMRHIEYQSFATEAYDLATTFQVQGGIGYLRVITDWETKTMEQEIYIKGCNNPLTILLDCDAKERDKSDGKYGLIFDKVLKDEFDKLYPEYKGMDLGGQSAIGENDEWIESDYIQICEYYRKVMVDDTLVKLPDGKVVQLSQYSKEVADDIIQNNKYPTRQMQVPKVEYYFIVGYKVVEERDWPGIYIPIVPVIGEEVVIDGILDRKGHTRNLKDPQRMYNYWSSAAVEHVALQSKTPYIAAAESIEGYESYWDTANKQNYSTLPYNALDDAANPLPAPQRAQPPQMAPAYIEGLKISGQDMELVSGQYAPQMGQPSNERSGKAINERQRQGDTATYHFIDNLGIAIRHLARIIYDLVPHIYDTQRVISCVAEDGSSFDLEIDPAAAQAYKQHLDHNNEVARRIFNPNVGKYSVQVDIGPSYGTKREEAFNAYTLLMTQNPNLASIIGDLLFSNADFPQSDEAARRLKRMVPPQALEKGPTIQEQQLMQQVTQLKNALAASLSKQSELALKLKGKEQQKDIDTYNAETQRLKVVLGEMGNDPYGIKSIVEQLVFDTLKTNLGLVSQSTEEGVEDESAKLVSPMDSLPPNLTRQPSPEPGVRIGAGGLEYMRDYSQMRNYRPVG